MQVILLEKHQNLGNLGEEVFVKSGFARNYLFPKYKAVIANKKNRLFFEKKIAEVKKNNLLNIEKIKEKEKKILDLDLKILVKITDKGKLFGSITSKDVIKLLKKNSIVISKNSIIIKDIIDKPGIYNIIININNNIKVNKKLSVIKDN